MTDLDVRFAPSDSVADDGDADTVDTFSKSFGSRVKEAREAAGLTQTQLADRLGMTRSSVANIEAGRQKPAVATAARCADVLRCDPGWLLSGDDAEVRRRGLDNLRTQLVSILRRLDTAGVEGGYLLPDLVAENLGKSAAGIGSTVAFIDKFLMPGLSSVDEGNTD